MFGKFKRGVIKDFKNKLLFGILIVLLLLLVCITVDYAENITIDNMDFAPKQNNVTKVKVVNNVSYVGLNEDDSVIVPKRSDKIHTIKAKTSKKVGKVPLVTITARPSCGCRYSYKWRTNTFVSYCPHCHHYNCLRNVHKWQAKYEQELTCTVCGADYCGQCGKEKYSYSRVYLRRA